MTKFIKLTERYNDRETAIIINCNCITALKKGNGGTDTMIQMRTMAEEGKNRFYFVKESIDQIWEMLNTDMTKPPVMMDANEYKKFKERV